MVRLLVIGLLLATCGAVRAADVNIEMPVKIHGTHVYVQVAVEKTDGLWFLLDSGAGTPVNLIDAQVAARLGLQGRDEKSGGAIGGDVKVQLTAPAKLRVGDLDLSPAQLAIIPLAEAAAEEGHAVDGILGYAFFSQFNPEIDYRRARMRLNQTPATSANDGVSMQVVEKHIRIKAEITAKAGDAPIPVTLTVDTGFDGALVLNSPFVAKHGLRALGGKASGGAALGGSGAGTSGVNVPLASLRIGKEQANAVETRLSSDTQGAFAGTDVDGFVGGGFLRNYSVLFDYKNGRLVLKR